MFLRRKGVNLMAVSTSCSNCSRAVTFLTKIILKNCHFVQKAKQFTKWNKSLMAGSLLSWQNWNLHQLLKEAQLINSIFTGCLHMSHNWPFLLHINYCAVSIISESQKITSTGSALQPQKVLHLSIKHLLFKGLISFTSSMESMFYLRWGKLFCP